MPVKRVRLSFPTPLYKALTKLGAEWGLDFQSLVTHCCARVLNYEQERKEMLAKGRSVALDAFQHSVDAEKNQK